MEHSVCQNLEDRAVCSCRDGFRALREDNAYCEGETLYPGLAPLYKLLWDECTDSLAIKGIDIINAVI